ncbi:P-loop containing nucleoside triphosphate hydrolase protein [Hyaloscypha finlandica]|nr:P-loop containing nucleoside triphosphate hydrolase protein [Hyaloscypha finlandica]
MTIDGHDLSTLTRDKIRACLIAILQDTFVLNNSIWLSVDLLGTVSDGEIIAVLGNVQLWNVIKSRGFNTAAPSWTATLTREDTANSDSMLKKEEVDPFEAPLEGSTLSHGQSQLFGLARASLLNDRSSSLILDEAASSVYAKTDELRQRIIREEFAEYTILTVAHRLDTIETPILFLSWVREGSRGWHA